MGLTSPGAGCRPAQLPGAVARHTTRPFGEALYYITVADAQLARGILREHVKAGTDRARGEGRRVGRPPVTARPAFAERWAAVEPEIGAGRVAKSEAAVRLGVGFATIQRLLLVDREASAS